MVPLVTKLKVCYNTRGNCLTISSHRRDNILKAVDISFRHGGLSNGRSAMAISTKAYGRFGDCTHVPIRAVSLEETWFRERLGVSHHFNIRLISAL